MRILTFLTAIVFMLASCQSGQEKASNDENLAEGVHKVTAREAIDAGGYTYLKVEENGREYWTAITRRPIEEGETYYFTGGMEMKNFTGKELDRTFESIVFIQNFSDKPIKRVAKKGMQKGQKGNPHEKRLKPKMEDINVEPVSGGVTLKELFSNKKDYKGKEVLVRGKVVKINKKIMDRNWVHIQDGTQHNDHFDLTITTENPIDFKTGDVVSFKGTLTLNKDFGFGYEYDFILEDAVRQQEL
ncbi:MAG: hypothetical protein K9I94_00475 [Bacteroidales bacterium]|nr:hypothetical protein [Bacteroidales bacterium]